MNIPTLDGMLPTSRVVAALVLGLGMALLTWGLLYPRVVDTNTKLPLSPSNVTITLVAEGAEFSTAAGEVKQEGITRQFHMEILPPTTGDIATVQVGHTMRTTANEDLEGLLGASVWTYSMDRVTGLNSGPYMVVDTLGTLASPVDISALWLKFPAQTEKTNYEVLDSTLRTAHPAIFIEEEQVDGRAVYRFQQNIEATELGPYTYSASREFWVDQETGMIVDLAEKIDTRAAPLEGEEVGQPILVYEARMPAEQVAQLKEAVASQDPGDRLAVLNTALAGIGAILCVIGLAMAFRKTRIHPLQTRP